MTINVAQSIVVSSAVVNGGDPAYLDSNGLAVSLAGQNSVVEQILVTFNQAVPGWVRGQFGRVPIRPR
jgi:hypothetical protein